MILLQLLKQLYDYPYYASLYIENIRIYVNRNTDITAKISSIENTLKQLGFDGCIEYAFNTNYRVWISESQELISYWEWKYNDNVPFVFEVQDLLDNDLDYLVLKYGKILLREVI